ncbi:hypothetical protein R6Q59_019488 [Mikania micrantha]
MENTSRMMYNLPRNVASNFPILVFKLSIRQRNHQIEKFGATFRVKLRPASNRMPFPTFQRPASVIAGAFYNPPAQFPPETSPSRQIVISFFHIFDLLIVSNSFSHYILLLIVISIFVTATNPRVHLQTLISCPKKGLQTFGTEIRSQLQNVIVAAAQGWDHNRGGGGGSTQTQSTSDILTRLRIVSSVLTAASVWFG